jgi:hypothetical protein
MSNDWSRKTNERKQPALFEFFTTFYTKFSQSSDFRSIFYGTVAVLFLLNYIYFSFQDPQLPPNSNRIILSGEPLKEDRVIPVSHYSSLPSTVEAVLEARFKKVNEQSDLLINPYRVSAVVFHGLRFDAPWVGLEDIIKKGKFSAIKNPDDIAYESRMILNPFLFLEPFFVDFSSLEGTSLVNNNTSFSPDVQPKIQEIIFTKNRDEQKIIINISQFYTDAIEKNLIVGKPSELVFNISAYNARDFGFNTLQFVPDASSNVSANVSASIPTRIKEKVELQDLICVELQGCNGRNVSNDKELHYTVNTLPATAVFELSRKHDQEILFSMRSIIELR